MTAFLADSGWNCVSCGAMAAGGLYVLLWVVDGKLLAAQSRSGTLAGKEHRAPRTVYSTEKIGDTFRSVPRVLPEAYVLVVRIGAKTAEAPVGKELYDRIRVGQRVRVQFERRRLTGSLRVLGVSWTEN